MGKSLCNAVHGHENHSYAIKTWICKPCTRGNRSKRDNQFLKRMKSFLICNTLFLLFHFISSSCPSLCSQVSFSLTNPKLNHLLPLHPPIKSSMLRNLIPCQAHHLSCSPSQPQTRTPNPCAHPSAEFCTLGQSTDPGATTATTCTSPWSALHTMSGVCASV